MNNDYSNSTYESAKKRVEAEKGFYSHLVAYIIINSALLLLNIDFDLNFSNWLRWNILTTPFFWGIGLLIHGVCVFGIKTKLFRDWEEQKIKELMNKDDF